MTRWQEFLKLSLHDQHDELATNIVDAYDMEALVELTYLYVLAEIEESSDAYEEAVERYFEQVAEEGENIEDAYPKL